MAQLSVVKDYCERSTCRRGVLLSYFGEDVGVKNCGKCDVCISPRETFDGTKAAQKLLVCVEELDQRFGMNHVIDVLIGSKNKKIITKQHHLLKSHGAGRDYSKAQWQAIAREMRQQRMTRVGGSRNP